MVTQRTDGTAQASVVNAGFVVHPVSNESAVGFVVQGGARRKLKNLRARPLATLVFRSGWEWVAIEGDVDLFDLGDLLEGSESDLVVRVFHEIYSAALGGAPADWASRDDAIEREGHVAVLVRPTRVYSNPTVT